MDSEQFEPNEAFERQVGRYTQFRWGGATCPDLADDPPNFCKACQMPVFIDHVLGEFPPCSHCSPTDSSLYHLQKSRVVREAYRRHADVGAESEAVQP